MRVTEILEERVNTDLPKEVLEDSKLKELGFEVTTEHDAFHNGKALVLKAKGKEPIANSLIKKSQDRLTQLLGEGKKKDTRVYNFDLTDGRTVHLFWRQVGVDAKPGELVTNKTRTNYVEIAISRK